MLVDCGLLFCGLELFVDLALVVRFGNAVSFGVWRLVVGDVGGVSFPRFSCCFGFWVGVWGGWARVVVVGFTLLLRFGMLIVFLVLYGFCNIVLLVRVVWGLIVLLSV